ncbi:MAG: tetratricopeptide repeat-containing serine/threonine-protein kinase [Planctomycetales bacterium]|nr:tetratricopeptide repeat-containing serine/threonine-protein kinase [Planctomycetales bacterium]
MGRGRYEVLDVVPEGESPRPRVEPRSFLADFGLAKAVATGSKLTRTGEALGTPAYMSPEQARGEPFGSAQGGVSSLTPATDVWSLGCVLYELLAGRAPFEGESTAAVVAQVLTREPAGLRSLVPGVPRDLERVTRACLAKAVGVRYASALSLRDDLDRILRGLRPRPPRPGRRGRWVAALLGTLAAMAAAAGWRMRAEDRVAVPPAAPTRPPGEDLAAQARARRTSDPGRAAQLLGDAIRLDPRRNDWRLERGLLLWAVGDGPGAVGEWRRVPPTAEEAARARLYQGLEAFCRLGFEEAALLLGESESDPGPVGRLARGACRAMAGDWPGAREVLRHAPGWEPALVRGYVQGEDPNGDPASSLRDYEEALAGGIPFVWAFNNRAVVRLRLEDHAGALRDCDEAIRLDSRAAKAWNNRGLARDRLGDHAGAIADFDQAIRLEPSYAKAWGNRAMARRLAGDLAGAIRDFDEAIRLQADSASAWANRGVIRRTMGDPEGAIRDLGEAIRLDPKMVAGWYNRAAARIDARDLSGALEDLEQALRLDPKDPRIWHTRGLAWSYLQQPEREFADYSEAIRLDPRSAQAYANRSSARRRLGDLRGVVADLEKAIEVASPDWRYLEEARDALARARAQLANDAPGAPGR